MTAAFLGHSGFLVELEGVSLLFDWWKGDLPPGKSPLLAFVSHSHPDHFNEGVFALDDGTRPVRFLLGKDIRLTEWNRKRWGVGEDAVCLRMGGGETAEPWPDVTVEAFPSTDEGAAFLVTAEGKTVFHAGDLNWWHWEGEDKAWNRNMEVNFKRYTEPLRGRRIDLAMLPLDPRLGECGFWGPQYFLELADIRRFAPMHQWEDYAFTEKFLSAHPEFRDRTVSIREAGQRFAF